MTDERALESLFRAGLNGDAAAYRRFLTRIVPTMRAIAASRLAGASQQLQEDIVQEALLALHLKRGSWRSDQPLMPWVRAIVIYKSVDALRRDGRHRAEPIDDHAPNLVAQSVDPLEGHYIEQALSALGGRDAELLRAMAAGSEHEDLARTFGLSAGAVRVAVHRALGRLAKRLKDVGGGE